VHDGEQNGGCLTGSPVAFHPVWPTLAKHPEQLITFLLLTQLLQVPRDGLAQDSSNYECSGVQLRCGLISGRGEGAVQTLVGQVINEPRRILAELAVKVVRVFAMDIAYGMSTGFPTRQNGRTIGLFASSSIASENADPSETLEPRQWPSSLLQRLGPRPVSATAHRFS